MLNQFLISQGEHLDLIDLHSDLQVIVGSGYCNVTLIGATVLLCAPDKPDELRGDEIPRKLEVGIQKKDHAHVRAFIYFILLLFLCLRL